MTTNFVRTIHADTPPFSLIEQKSLLSRLVKAVESAVREFAEDPRGFIKELPSANTRDAKRRKRIYFGLAGALVLHVAVIVLVAVLGLPTMFVKQVEGLNGEGLTSIPVAPRTSEKTIKQSSVPRGDKEAGSGGGGDQNPLPATRGPLPLMSTNPQIVKANTPSVPLAVIKLPPTIVGPDGSPPPPGLALGIPDGAIAAAPSPGPGIGEGIGGPRGSGAGPGSGSSTGPGETGTGPGGKGRIGLPTGSDVADVPIPYNIIKNFRDLTQIVWLHRPTPITTPEAQANKVKGEVWLRATFGADGRITDIEVIRDVPYMTQSAIESLRRSTFRPATIKGRPVTLTRVPVRINVDVFQR